MSEILSPYLVSIDPATKKLGVALFCGRKLVSTFTVQSRGEDPQGRRAEICQRLSKWLLDEMDYAYWEKMDFKIVSEEPTLLRPKSNNTMQRMLGVLERNFYPQSVVYIHPKTVKMMLGHGDKDKLEVALAAGKLLETEEEREVMAQLISEEKWDETDAIAIAMCYYMNMGLIKRVEHETSPKED